MMSLAHGKATESAARLALGEQLIKVLSTSTHTDRYTHANAHTHTHTHTHTIQPCLSIVGNEGILQRATFHPTAK